jgi:hypothetical protein
MVHSGDKSLSISSLRARNQPIERGARGFVGGDLPAAMERFLSGSATKEEIRAVVRHLLAQSPGRSTSARRSLLQSPLLVVLFGKIAKQK